LQSIKAFLEGLVVFIDFQTDEEGKEELVVLKETHAHVAVQNLPELVLQNSGAFRHLLQLLLFGHVCVGLASSSTPIILGPLIVFIFVNLGLVLVIGAGVGQVESLAEESTEPVHRELIHVVQELQVLHGKVKSRSLLGCDLEFLSEVSDLVLVILGLLQLLFNFVCGLL
jgi:hypothetical protein